MAGWRSSGKKKKKEKDDTRGWSGKKRWQRQLNQLGQSLGVERVEDPE